MVSIVQKSPKKNIFFSDNQNFLFWSRYNKEKILNISSNNQNRFSNFERSKLYELCPAWEQKKNDFFLKAEML